MAVRPIDLVIFPEHPHCHSGSLRGVQKRPLVDVERDLGGAQIAKESSNGQAPHWKVELVGLPASIRQWLFC